MKNTTACSDEVLVAISKAADPNSGVTPVSYTHLIRIDLFDLLHDLEQSGTTRNAIGFQGRGYSKADGFLSAGGICHDQICGKRVEVSSGAFCTRVIAFKIYRKICALHRTLSSFLTARYFAFFSSSISF